MKKYHCEECNMSIEPLSCGECHTTLIQDTIDVDGNQIGVAKCPKGCGMIKSPQCCGKDMQT